MLTRSVYVCVYGLSACQQDPDYMEQPSPTDDSKHLQEDTERAINKAAAEQDEKNPEALLYAVRKLTHTCTRTLRSQTSGVWVSSSGAI